MERKRAVQFGCAALVIIICMIIISIIIVYFLTDINLQGLLGENRLSPVVTIIHPTAGMSIKSGQTLMVAVQASSQSGLASINFMVDGVEVGQMIPKDTPQDIHTVFPWMSSKAGTHRLSVISYDVSGQAGAESGVNILVRAVPGLAEVPEEAQIADAVQPAAADVIDAADVWEPVQNDGGHQNDVAQGDAQADAEPDDNEPVGDDVDVADADEQNDVLLEQLDDDPPFIRDFNAGVIIAEADNAAAVMITVQGKAVDDLGLDRLEVVWVTPDRQVGDTSVQCFGQQVCEMSFQNDHPQPGIWMYRLNAWDNSGQVTSAFSWVEVIAGNDDLPAAVEHEEPQDLFFDFLPLEFDIDQDALEDQQDVIDVEAILEIMEALGISPNENAVQVGGRCLELNVVPREDGNLITIEVTCDFDVDEGRMLFPHITKRVINSGDRGSELFIDDWYDPARRTFTAGETLSWLDTDVFCGSTILYQAWVDRAISAPVAQQISDIDRDMNIARARVEVNSNPCAHGSFSDVSLVVEPVAQGMAIKWTMAEEGSWQPLSPDQQIQFVLHRHDVQEGWAVVPYRETILMDQIQPGSEFMTVDDDIECGKDYWYTLSAFDATFDQDPENPDWLFHVQAPGSREACQDEIVSRIPFVPVPYWFNDEQVKVRLEAHFPAGMNWPQGDPVELVVLSRTRGVNGCQMIPCAGIWTIKHSAIITGQVRSNGLVFVADDDSVDFSQNYIYALGLMVDGELSEIGPCMLVTIPPDPALSAVSMDISSDENQVVAVFPDLNDEIDHFSSFMKNLLYKKWFSLFGLTKKSVGGSAQELFWTVNEDVKVNYGQGYTIGLERSH